MTDRTDSGIPPGDDPGKRDARAPGNANYVLGVLFVVYVFNFIDRQLLSVFIGPIQEEFEISDTWMGVLGGFAFALFYTFAGIPIARWADRGNRVSIIAIGLAVWSAMTVASGLARSFTQLALARVGGGVGEAAGSPPAPGFRRENSRVGVGQIISGWTKGVSFWRFPHIWIGKKEWHITLLFENPFRPSCTSVTSSGLLKMNLKSSKKLKVFKM